MKSKILLLAVVVALFSSCTTAYKTGQTPDDVYFSPARPQQSEEYVQRDKRSDASKYNNVDEYYEDQYLRMKVRNRNLWSDLNDPFYNSYRYNYSAYNCNCLGNPWTPASYWNNHFNPYYQGTVIVSPQTTVRYSGPRTFNLNSYNDKELTNGTYSNPKFIGSGSGYSNSNNNNTYTSPRNSNSNNNNSGNILRDIFGGGNNNNNSSGNNSNNNSSSSSSSSSSSGSSSGSSTPAPVRKF